MNLAPYPLWVLVLVRFFQKRRSVVAGSMEWSNRLVEMDGMMRGLAVPRGRVERFLMSVLLRWVYAEQAALNQLIRLSVQVWLHDTTVPQSKEQK